MRPRNRVGTRRHAAVVIGHACRGFVPSSPMNTGDRVEAKSERLGVGWASGGRQREALMSARECGVRSAAEPGDVLMTSRPTPSVLPIKGGGSARRRRSRARPARCQGVLRIGNPNFTMSPARRRPKRGQLQARSRLGRLNVALAHARWMPELATAFVAFRSPTVPPANCSDWAIAKACRIASSTGRARSSASTSRGLLDARHRLTWARGRRCWDRRWRR